MEEEEDEENSRVLGQGAFATVTRVVRHRKTWARKRTDGSAYGIDPSAVREATFLQTFHHPFVLRPYLIRVFKRGTVDVYLPLAQMNLEKWVQRASATQRREKFCEVAYRLLCVLDALHKAHILHRDVKPSNVLLNEVQEIFLADLGSARELCVTISLEEEKGMGEEERHTDNFPESPNPPLSSPLSSLTEVNLEMLLTRDMVTYVYRPPEMSATYTTRSDIYSLGCTLIHVLANEFPTFFSDLRPPPPAAWHYILSTLEDSIPSSWSRLLLRMTATDPTERPSADDLLREAEWFGSYPPRPVVSVPAPLGCSSLFRHGALSSKQQPLYACVLKACERWCLSVLPYDANDELPSLVSLRTIANFDRLLDVDPRMDSGLASLVCLQLVTKMISSQYLTPEDLLHYWSDYYGDSVPCPSQDDVLRMEAYVFFTLQRRIL